tara:strand:+ start:1617 stop:1931 length:315 start_codon:yes stop_codon:yes gene_type:complete
MDPQLIEIIAGFGPVGIASAAIFYMYIRMSKRMEVQTDNFQQQLREQMDECNKREAMVRDKFEKVVMTYNQQAAETTQKISLNLEKILLQLQDLETTVKENRGR